MDQITDPLTDDIQTEIAALATRFRRANGPLMSLVSRIGGTMEHQLGAIPVSLRARIEAVIVRALGTSYDVAQSGARLPDIGARGPVLAAMASGAAGGAGGIATSVAELPVTITVILHAIQREAAAAGFDVREDSVRAECLRVFGAGTTLSADDGINTSFVSARITLTGPAMQKLISTVAPKLAASMGQKLMAQAVPVLGALTGAALNAAFVRYYAELAAIRFALLRLGRAHGEAAVLAAFSAASAGPKVRMA